MGHRVAHESHTLQHHENADHGANQTGQPGGQKGPLHKCKL